MNVNSEEDHLTSSVYYQTIQESEVRDNKRFYYCCFCISSSIFICITLFTLFLIFILNSVQCEKYLCDLLSHDSIFSCIEDKELVHNLIDIKNQICIRYI